MSTEQGPRPYHEFSTASTSSRQDAQDLCDPAPPAASQPPLGRTCDPPPSVFDTEPPHHHGVFQPRITTRGWSLNDILKLSPNFHRINRISYSSPTLGDLTAYEKAGIPLIVHGWNRHPRWAKAIFNVEWLQKNGDQNPSVRNVHNWMDFNISVDTFVEKLRASPVFADPNETERLYGKDGECPAAWTEWLQSRDVIPQELLLDGSNDFLRFLPEKAKVQTLMCYMGIGDTFTPFHKDLCASSGHNLMCYTERGGSSYWFMTKASDAPRVASYFHHLGQELDLETHVVTMDELANAPFDVYIGEQTLGDLVLVPPRSCHQVINHGGITIKTSWSRMSLEGLQVALWHELPIYHRVCRSETYKVKSNIYHALQHYTDIADKLSGSSSAHDRAVSIEKLKQLFTLFDDILAEEFSTVRDSMSHVSQSGSDHNDDMTCDFCAADIFQSFFECERCAPSSSSGSSQVITLGDGLILCPSCYVEGRTCRCGNMEPVQCRPFNILLEARDKAMQVICDADSSFTTDHAFLSEDPLRLLSNQHAGVFEAACRLFQQRQSSTKTNKSCRPMSKDTHAVEWSAAVSCRSCHSSRCYTHLLYLNSMHSVEAIFVSERHEGGAGWHRHHRDTIQKFMSSEQCILEDEECGARPDMLLRLAYLAKKYDSCRAANPELTKHGWYDRYVQLVTIPIARSPDKVLVGSPEHADEDATPSEASGNASCGASTNPGTRSSSYVTQVLASSQVSRCGSRIPGASTISARRGEPWSSSERNLLNSDSTYAPVGGASTSTLSRDSKDPYTTSVSDTEQGPSVSDAGEQPMSECESDLTELPPEFNSSPLVQPPPEVNSEPPRPSVVQPIPFSLRRKPKQRVIMECVEIPKPAWKRRAGQDKSLSSLQNKRRRSDGPASDDDVPVNELSRRPMPSAPVRSAHIEVSEPPILLDVSKRDLIHVPIMSTKRRLSQSNSRRPSSRKRTRSVTVVPDTSSTETLANALNRTFEYNSSTRSRGEGTFDDNESGLHANGPINHEGHGDRNHSLGDDGKERSYRDIGVGIRPRFTKHLPTVSASEQSDTIAKLQGENSQLQMQMESLQRENEAYRHREEAWRLASGIKPSLVPPPTQSASQATSHLPSHSASHFTSPSRLRVDSPDALLTSLKVVQEPLLPPIETLPPSTPTPLPSSRKRDSPAVTHQPRKCTPTEPRSYRVHNGVGPQPTHRNARHDKTGHEHKMRTPRERGVLGWEPSTAHSRKPPSATSPQSDLQYALRPHAEHAIEGGRSPPFPHSVASQTNGVAHEDAIELPDHMSNANQR